MEGVPREVGAILVFLRELFRLRAVQVLPRLAVQQTEGNGSSAERPPERRGFSEDARFLAKGVVCEFFFPDRCPVAHDPLHARTHTALPWLPNVFFLVFVLGFCFGGPCAVFFSVRFSVSCGVV